VRNPARDPKRTRVFVVVSRPVLIESRHATVVCAPVHTTRSGLDTQVEVGPEVGLKHPSAIHCDALMSIPKSVLTDFVGRLSADQLERLNAALRVALALEA
jgi:mRNA interferase MazF